MTRSPVIAARGSILPRLAVLWLGKRGHGGPRRLPNIRSRRSSFSTSRSSCDWPAQSFPDARAPFVIGVLGRDPFGKRTPDEAVRGETVNGRALVVERYRSVNEPANPAQILFIDRSAGSDVGKTLESLGHQGTLTVSDSTRRRRPP